MSTPRRALILVGHGSHLSADSSTPIYQHAARIRATGAFDEVLEAFWKEEPSLRDAIDLVESPQVFIIPLFLAEGYFTRQVVPRELGIDGSPTRRGGRVIHYGRPVGTHPAMASLVIARALEMPDSTPKRLSETSLLIIGHGTPRSRTSGDTVYRLVEEIRERKIFGEVDCGFLDEEPRIGDVLARAKNARVALVPFFIAEGWHTATTIPEDVGLATLPDDGERQVWYAPPIGTMPEVTEVILDLAASAAAEAGGLATNGDDTPTPIRRARLRFMDWLARQEGSCSVLQVAIQPVDGGGYRLSNVADAEAAHGLTRIDTLADLQALVRFNAAGEYRPLRTRNDLRSGWTMCCPDPRAVWDALAIIYPAALHHRSLLDEDELEIVPFASWAARQTGIYESLREMNAEALDSTIARCCGSCLRRPLWMPQGPAHAASDAVGMERRLEVPCREPCTLFATVARDSL